MRLTLRTLLAYLDDTLEPLEIKAIGQKVGESETAQELIARIKQATRRRRITTPPATGPNSFDPNMVADYLDSELSAEQVAELEKICLESDVHLAEVASCHQILTLVLGEPAGVPPTAKERMYALVRGREAIPFRKAATTGGNAAAPTSADADADEMFLLGLPFYRRGSWLRWALPLAAVLLFAIVGVALWQSINGLQQPATQPQVAQGTNTPPPANNADQAPPKAAVKDTNKEKNNTAVEVPKTQNQTPNNPPEKKPSDEAKSGVSPDVKKPDKLPSTVQPEKSTEAKPENPPEQRPTVSPKDRQAEASSERIEVGKYRTDNLGPPSLLAQRKSDKDDWSRVKPGNAVSSSDQLVSLPGYASEVLLNCGVNLLLRGHLREFTPRLEKNEAGLMDYLQECAIVLHKPKGMDVDLTLERGRLFLSNQKEQTARLVRLRFENNKVWDLTLQPRSEMVVELLKLRLGGEPLSLLNLFLLKGNAGLAADGYNYPNLSVPGLAYFHWDSSNPSVYFPEKETTQQLDHAVKTLFAKVPTINTPEASGMERALKAIKDKMIADKPPVVALQEVLDTPEQGRPFEHRLAAYCLAAMGEIKVLMNILGSADLPNTRDRVNAIVALRRWLDRGRDQRQKLLDPKTRNGFLVSEMMYSPDDAKRIVELIGDDPTHEQIYSTEIYDRMARDLTSEKVAIAELARWRLTLLGIVMFRLDMPKLKNFNAALPRDKREEARQEVLKMVSGGTLPPPLHPGKPGAGGTSRPAPKGGSGQNR